MRALTLLIGVTKDDQLMKATFATHNQESIEKSLDTLKKCEDVSEDSIQFAQINLSGSKSNERKKVDTLTKSVVLVAHETLQPIITMHLRKGGFLKNHLKL